MMNELRTVFNEIDICEEEDTLLDKRLETFIEVLKSIGNKNPSLCISNDYDIRNSIYTSKQELKRYEKELEGKSSKNASSNLNNPREDFTMKNNFNINSNNEILTVSNQKTKVSKLDVVPESFNNGKKLFLIELKNDAYENPSQDYYIEDNPFISQLDDFPINSKECIIKPNENSNVFRLSEKLKISDELVSVHKNLMFDHLSQMAKTHEEMINETRKRTSNIYKSKVLNDLYVKPYMIFR